LGLQKKFAPTEIFVPMQKWRSAQFTLLQRVGTSSRLREVGAYVSFKKLASEMQQKTILYLS
jgi:hypothetical protein